MKEQALLWLKAHELNLFEILDEEYVKNIFSNFEEELGELSKEDKDWAIEEILNTFK